MSEIATSFEQKEKTAQLKWTCFILLFFLIQAVIWIIAFSVTLGDPSHAVVSGYAEKALHWDEEKAVRIASDQLGWLAEIKVGTSSDLYDRHSVSLTIKDASESPVMQASIRLVAFHVARAAETQVIELFETGQGVYSGTIQVRQTGYWQFDGEARRGNDLRIIDQRLQIETSQ